MDTEGLLVLDELRWIVHNPERCPKCNHLKIFHNQHCCSFCIIPDCECKETFVDGK